MDYYCVKTIYPLRGSNKAEIINSVYGINRRPESKTTGSTYYDWLTESEIAEQYPGLAKRYGMKK